MIFNTVSYYVLFLLPAAVLFKIAPIGWRPWVLVLSASFFYLYFSMHDRGVAGAFCLSIFLWESIFSRLYRPAALVCLIGVAQSIVFLVVFKYWNYLTGLI